ncbi:MAG: helix-turn-helix domain-containing protein [Clostridia bacterium]|nr:helix-turn-helix domain-containing protein [Clostridia bacterium]
MERRLDVNEDEEIKNNYYAVIPATVRYNKELKPAEKLLYGEVTALANKMGYCYAQNKYFAELYNVTNTTVSKWLSHLNKLGYINIEIIRNEKKEIVTRHIYINDNPYCQKRQYPYCQKEQYPIVQNDKENNININKDDLYLFIINNSSEIPIEFYIIVNTLDFVYPEETLSKMQEDKVAMIKDIVYVLYDLYNSEFKNIVLVIGRETLIKLYILSKEKEPYNFISYFRKSIINQFMT